MQCPWTIFLLNCVTGTWCKWVAIRHFPYVAVIRCISGVHSTLKVEGSRFCNSPKWSLMWENFVFGLPLKNYSRRQNYQNLSLQITREKKKSRATVIFKTHFQAHHSISYQHNPISKYARHTYYNFFLRISPRFFQFPPNDSFPQNNWQKWEGICAPAPFAHTTEVYWWSPKWCIVQIKSTQNVDCSFPQCIILVPFPSHNSSFWRSAI